MIGSKRRLFACVISSLALFAATSHQAGAAYPDRTVRIICGFAPGGGTDVVARLVAQKLSEMWGQSVVVENRPGADGSIAADLVAHAPPDGYAIAFVSNAHTVTPSEYKLNYDAIKSFTPVTIAATIPDLFLINKTIPSKTLKEFIAYAKQNKGKLNFGSAGTGTSPYLEMIDFMKRTDIDMVHVAYKGSAPSIVGILGNDIQVMFASLSSTLAQVQSGQLTALGIGSDKRAPVLPNVPTVAEAADLPGYTGGVWYGALAPAGLPKDIAAKLNKDMVAAIQSPTVQEQYAKLGFETAAVSSEEMAKIMQSDMDKWSKVIKSTEGK